MVIWLEFSLQGDGKQSTNAILLFQVFKDADVIFHHQNTDKKLNNRLFSPQSLVFTTNSAFISLLNFLFLFWKVLLNFINIECFNTSSVLLFYVSSIILSFSIVQSAWAFLCNMGSILCAHNFACEIPKINKRPGTFIRNTRVNHIWCQSCWFLLCPNSNIFKNVCCPHHMILTVFILKIFRILQRPKT